MCQSFCSASKTINILYNDVYHTYDDHICGLMIKVNHRFIKSITDSTKSTVFNLKDYILATCILFLHFFSIMI